MNPKIKKLEFDDEFIIDILDDFGDWSTTNRITKKCKELGYPTTHWNTVNKILSRMQRKNRIEYKDIGTMTVWRIKKKGLML